MSAGYLAITAIFKWEWPWLEEWLVYHRQLGVEHFYLCANEENEDLSRSLSLLRPFAVAGLVTLHSLSGPGGQGFHYSQSIQAARGKYRWLAGIDIDELLHPLDSSTVPQVLQDYERYPAVCFNWRCFGSGGLRERPPSQLSGFLWRAPDDWEPNRHVKTFVDPAIANRFPNPHYADVPAVDENFKPVSGPWNDVTARRMVVNHYMIRSQEDFELKSRRGRADLGPNTYDRDFLARNDRNDIFDDRLARLHAGNVEAELTRWRTAPPPAGFFLRR